MIQDDEPVPVVGFRRFGSFFIDFLENLVDKIQGVEMASKPIIVQQQNINDALPVKQKNMVPDGRIRRALGDIGNVETDQGIDAKLINRPITRGFCAKLLADAKAQVAAGGGGVENKKVAVKKKVVTVKPKPPVHEVIVISPDTMEKIKSKQILKKEGISRKKRQSFTSILTARSKAACGLNEKKKENIVSIVDAGDIENELAVVEYIEDMYTFYKEIEEETQVKDYIKSLPEMSVKKRAILVDWLIEVQQKFELTMETLYLTINIMDRFLSSEPKTERDEFQLVGIGAMLMASKYEEIWAPEVNDLVSISDGSYSHKEILRMEKRILERLEWNLTVPTPYVFLVRFIKVAALTAEEKLIEENMSYFLAEIGMVNYATVLYCPSMIAASSVYAARSILNKKRKAVWNETLELHTGYSETQLMDCANMLIDFRLDAAQKNFRSVCSKYSTLEKGNVAMYTSVFNA
ncbi:G2/mitotic-specific cyclin S13-7-like [Impatiens glandulifera]|uniref:G2/mitotic-specific cyclin S13-7-like n=1 Tax=Impatiens glandulifera TaxID=253017 RepID=UPI001FB0CCB1|nr:G2/mitotic-specific cyclin S13-7-like [Impatiens glandulifera]